jgi:hypothetical protein
MEAGNKVEFVVDDCYLGEGISTGLSRGLLVTVNGKNITGEGMGLGSIAARYGGYSYFSRHVATERTGTGTVEKTFLIDTRMAWAYRGTVSYSLTRCLEFIADCYMAMPSLQFLVALESPLKSRLAFAPFLEPVAPLVTARFTYRTDKERDGRVSITCRITSHNGPHPELFILNELGAASFTHSLTGGEPGSPPSGWRRFPDGRRAALYSPESRLAFSVIPGSVVSDADTALFWGRESTENLHWAGYEIRVRPRTRDTRTVSCSYEIELKEMEGAWAEG